ncbi:hypothetical protein Tco_0026085 [Tanacetum coccineum]
MRIFFSSNSDRLAAIARDVLDSVDERVITSALSCIFDGFMSYWQGMHQNTWRETGTKLLLQIGSLLELREEEWVVGRVVANTRGGSAIVVTETSTSEVASVLNIKSILVSGLGLSMLETKLDDTEELMVC